MSDKEKFLQRVGRTNKKGCHIWVGHVSKNGYGKINLSSKVHLAHRIAYSLYKGPIPKGKLVCHSCDNRRCVNPKHLFLGTHKDNSEDMVSKGRQVKGEKNGRCLLTEKQVREIKKKYIPRKYSIYKLGKEYGISPQHVHYIVSGRYWRHVNA